MLQRKGNPGIGFSLFITLIIISPILTNLTLRCSPSNQTMPKNPISSADPPGIVFWENFTGQLNGAYPNGWTCNDNRPLTCYIDVISEAIRVMDHNNGQIVYGWKPFTRNITNGLLSFSYDNLGGYTTGSAVADHYVTLQNVSGTDVLVIDITTDRDGNFISIRLNGVGGSTHYAESVPHNVTLEFTAGDASLYVDDVLEVTTTYASQALGRLYVGTTIEMNGLGVLFDDFFVSENLPSVTHPDDLIYLFGATSNTISWIVTDNTTGTTSFTIYRNGIWIVSASWVSGIPVEVNVDGLAIGSYNYTIIVHDGYGGVARDEVDVEVLSEGGFDYTLVFMLVVVFGIVAGVTGAIGYKKRVAIRSKQRLKTKKAAGKGATTYAEFGNDRAEDTSILKKERLMRVPAPVPQSPRTGLLPTKPGFQQEGTAKEMAVNKTMAVEVPHYVTVEEMQKTEAEVKIDTVVDRCLVCKQQLAGDVFICPECKNAKYHHACIEHLMINGESCWYCQKPLISEDLRKELEIDRYHLDDLTKLIENKDQEFKEGRITRQKYLGIIGKYEAEKKQLEQGIANKINTRSERMPSHVVNEQSVAPRSMDVVQERIVTVFEPELLQKLKDMQLSSDIYEEVVGRLKNIPPERRLAYLEQLFKDDKHFDEDF